ncbi:hypothetical protein IF1G_02469 [Cordyceps javanica]|uniref:Uncharacterized protein n=1 Tax=Cordyceps javanica TaxID=43265 RepID=A0A545W6J6_9HYPO|nr:hypothetical protein IF1G_02469 [Cordyceps javanica]TQW09604.1 hypothetical protein IF2G_02394 [Cordyceps javanica]
MKAIFFSLAALALTAFAAPAVQDGAVLVTTVATENAGSIDKRENSGAADIIKALTEGNNNIKDITGSINSTLADVQSGKTSKEEASKQTNDDLQNLLDELAGIFNQVLNKVGIATTKGEFQTILNEAGTLLSEVLSTVKVLLTLLGALPALNSVVQSVLNLLSKILVALTVALGTVIVPGLLAILSPLLAALGAGLVGPILNVVAGLVAGISPPVGA